MKSNEDSKASIPPRASARASRSTVHSSALAVLIAAANFGCSCEPGWEQGLTGIVASFELDEALDITQVRVRAVVDDAHGGETAFDPVIVPEQASGPLGELEDLVILFSEELQGRDILITAEGLSGGTPVTMTEERVTLTAGILVEVTFVLRAPTCADDALEGSACDDGNFCTVSTTCDADGTCGGGEPRCPMSPCTQAVCDAIAEECLYENRPGGTSCGDGEICDGEGGCLFGCWIGGELFLAGDSDPDEPCSRCSPADSTEDWTLVSGEISSETAVFLDPASALQWTVPEGVTLLEVKAWGAGGGGGGGGTARVGGEGGGGGYVDTAVSVTPGETLSLFIGGGGGGGLNNNKANSVGTGGGGGGLTGVFGPSGVLAVAAGGGGGGGGDYQDGAAPPGGDGGAGGGAAGSDGGGAGPSGGADVEGGLGGSTQAGGAAGGVENPATTPAEPGDALNGGDGGSPAAVDAGAAGGAGGQNGGGAGGLSKATGGTYTGRAGGGGGGSGYFGGGGGEAANAADTSGGGGGGGSSYSAGRNSELIGGAGRLPGNAGDSDRGDRGDGGAGGGLGLAGEPGSAGLLIIDYFVCE